MPTSSRFFRRSNRIDTQIQTATLTAAGVPAGGSFNLDWAIAPIVYIHKIIVSGPCWLRAYASAAGRTEDAARSLPGDPIPDDSTLVFEKQFLSDDLDEVIRPATARAAQSWINTENPQASTFYLIVRNDDTVTQDLEIQIEHAKPAIFFFNLADSSSQGITSKQIGSVLPGVFLCREPVENRAISATQLKVV